MKPAITDDDNRGPAPGAHRWARVGRLVAAAAALAAVGCDPDQGPPAGAPVLLGVDVVDATGAPVMMDPAAPMPMSARVHFVFRFDRLLDPELIEEIVDGKPVGSGEVAKIEAPGEPDAQVTYIPNGDAKHKLLFASGPALVVTPSPTLPSGADIKVSLNKDHVQSRGGSAFVAAAGVSDQLSFPTEPFAASIVATGATTGQPIEKKTSLSVTFNNLPAEDIIDRVLVQVFDAAGQPLPEVQTDVTADAMDPTRLVIAPSSGSWPAGAKVTVTVDGKASDALGMQMSERTEQSFEVGP